MCAAVSMVLSVPFDAAPDGASASPEPSVPSGDDDRATFERLFLANLDVIESVVRFVCRRHKLAVGDVEEFASEVKLRFVERDYEVLRKFEGRSTLRTYVTVVVQRMYLDYRNHLWGKWRPSAEARRLGPLAVRLEALITRDGLGCAAACREVVERERLVTSGDPLMDIARRLPIRMRRVAVGEAALASAVSAAHADEGAILRDRRGAADRISRALSLALAALPDQDRLILRMRFVDAFSVADIARVLHLDTRRLYRRVESLLRQLRRSLLGSGITSADAQDLLDGTADVSLPPLKGWIVPATPFCPPSFIVQGSSSAAAASNPVGSSV